MNRFLSFYLDNQLQLEITVSNLLSRLCQDIWKYNMESESRPHSWRRQTSKYELIIQFVFISVDKNAYLMEGVQMTCIRGLPQDEINPCLEIYISSYWLQKEKSCLRFSTLSLYIWSQLTQGFYLFQRKWVSCYLLPSLVRKLDWLSIMLKTFFFLM